MLDQYCCSIGEFDISVSVENDVLGLTLAADLSNCPLPYKVMQKARPLATESIKCQYITARKTLPDVYQFLKFFDLHTKHQICDEVITKDPTTS